MRQTAFEYANKIINISDPDPSLRNIYDALRLKDLCNYDYNNDGYNFKEEQSDSSSFSKEKTIYANSEIQCSSSSPCIYLEDTILEKKQKQEYSEKSRAERSRKNIVDHQYFFTSIHQALLQARSLRREKEKNSNVRPKIILRRGTHSLEGRTLNLTKEDDGLMIIGYPGEEVWISGGLAIGDNVDFKEVEDGIYLANLTGVLTGYTLPKIMSLFTSNNNEIHRRYVRARYPNADPEIDQWGYASPQNLNFSLSPELVLEWHRPPPTSPPNFTWFDFSNNPPFNVPLKNDSKQEGYNWYGSGKGGACSNIWGPDANSYWCSNASQGGWAEVDQECAITGQMQLPLGMTYEYNSSKLSRFQNISLKGGFLHAWHSQSWSMHMFEIINQSLGEMFFAEGGGRQGGRNWCRCDQCTYAGPWCGQHQNPSWNDTRLISGTWMIENIKDELDQVGEYYFDHESKILLVKVNSTTVAQNFKFRIGMLEQLIGIRDDASNITIQNVGFRDMAPTYMGSWSAPSGGDWSLHRGGAVFLENVTNIDIRNCIFRRIDGNAGKLFLNGHKPQLV